MSKVPFEQAVTDAVRHNPRYSADAYHFLRDALDMTIKTMQKGRKDAINHVSGAELCEGVREYALQQFGPMVPTIFETWGIGTTRDIGEMVFNLIQTGAFSRSDSDRLEDFENVYRFEDAFEKPYLPVRNIAPAPPNPSTKRTP
jgi:uncharacterized repeat protein (TIGR04138 family)